MRPRLVTALIFAVSALACSKHPAHEQTRDQPSGAVAILVKGVDGLPTLEMRASFAPGVAPEPHVQPLATVLVDARKHCFTQPQPQGFVAALHVDIRGGKLAAQKRNEQGACLAQALAQHAIDDAHDASVDLQIAIAP